jgi:hypothetical protein
VESPGSDYYEDVKNRVVTLDKPYADVVRVWKQRNPSEGE